ncbi:MAG: pseudouridine synthase [Pseudomonadota bacterium]
MPTPTLRLNRFLAQLGVASRRKVDEMIAAGRISIKGKTISELGAKVAPGTKGIEIDGMPLERSQAKKVYFVLHKPRGVMTTLSDPEGRPTVADLIAHVRERIYPIGRLDYDTEGVLLFTNDGDLAHQLAHPKFEVKKTYMVKVKGRPAAEVLLKLRRGVRPEDGIAKPIELEFDRATRQNSWYRMVVAEGRNRLVKRMWMRVGHPVAKLIRVNFAGITLGDLKVGELRPLKPTEIQRLCKSTETR